MSIPANITVDSISIAAWNICGIKNKIDDPDFMRELLPHDVIILGETFSENDALHIEGYKCKNIFRNKKHKKAKRFSGGISVLTKTNISKFITPVKTTAEHFIWIKISKQLTGYPLDTYCCCAYIPPYGSPYYETHPDINLFDMLNTDLTHFGNLGHVMVSGDLNSRIGRKSDTLLDTEMNIHTEAIPDLNTIMPPPRCSMDSKTNVWGNNLIDVCIAHNLCLLNGRTVGDLAGNFTFFGAGCSVIDLTVVDEILLHKTLAFKVHKFLPDFSSHCKIETVLRCSPITISVHDPTTQNLMFDKFVWNKQLSQEKLLKATSSPEFIALKTKIINTSYDSNCSGTESLCKDVDNAFTFLHSQSCDKIRVGKKSRAKAKRQKWFSPDCVSLRKKLRRAANHLHRHPFNPQSSEEVFSLNRQYNKLLKKSKRQYLDLNMKKLIHSVDKQEMWSILSEIRGKKPGAPVPMKDLHDHFKAVLNNSPKNVIESKLKLLEKKVSDFTKSRPTASTGGDTLMEGGYTLDFVAKIAKTLKNGKASFLDGSINEVIKHSIPSTSPILVKLFNHIELSSIFPTSWKSSFLVPLHKKGSQGDPDNYRGLAVGSNIGKMYTKCLNTKMKNFVEKQNILSPHQFGFRDDYRTTDAIFSLRSMVSHYKNGKKPVYACFVDFSKAFDSVNRLALAYKLGKIGIKGNMLKLFQDMYSSASYIIKSGGNFSVPIASKLGVKQGCNLSPLLFNIFINDIHSIFNKNCRPLNINNWEVNSLSFADDLVVLSETESGLKNCISTLETYCNEWGLKVNPLKTKVLVFNKPFSKNIKRLSFSIDGNPIAVTNSYCYLGIEISNTGSFTKATDTLYKKALRALYSVYSSIDIRSDEKNVPLFLKLFDSLVKPVLLYGSEIWGSHTSTENNCINKFINKFYRTLLGVPRYSSKVGTHAELGRFPVTTNIHQSMLKYWFRIITLPTNRLASHCYWTLLDSNTINDPWLNTIQNIISSTGQYYVWNDQKILASQEDSRTLRMHEAYISQTLKDISSQQASEKIDNETKLSLLKNCKSQTKASKYLNSLASRKKRSLFSKLRLGTLDIEIENSRKHKIPRAERLCKLCETGEVENEIHFILNCPALSPCREHFINLLSTHNVSFARMSPKAKITYLYFNENLPNRELVVAADLLCCLKDTRDILTV